MKFRRPLLILFASLIAILAVAIVGLKFVLPGELKKRITKAIEESCDDCDVQLGSIEIGVAPLGRFVFHDIRFQAGQGGRSMAEGRIATLTANLALSESSRAKLVFERIEFEGVNVTYSEGEAKKKDAPEKPAGKKMDFIVNETKIDKAEFRYAHTWNHKTSLLHIHEITGTITGLGTTSEIQNKISEAKFTGRIENSGRGELSLAALTRPGPHHVDFNLLLEGQKLDDVGRFFKSNDGLELHGTLEKAHATVKVRDQVSIAKVQAIYKDVEIKQNKTPQTSGLEAFFTNLGAAVLVTKSNDDRLAADQTSEAEVKREKDEALVHFILRSMKEQLLDVAKKKDSRTIEKQNQASIAQALGAE